MERDLAVLELQQALRAVLAASGYPAALYPDGFFGPETGRAVRLFQQLYGLPETGEVSQALWEGGHRRFPAGEPGAGSFPSAGFPERRFCHAAGSTGGPGIRSPAAAAGGVPGSTGTSRRRLLPAFMTARRRRQSAGFSRAATFRKPGCWTG